MPGTTAPDPLAGLRVVIAHDNLYWYGGAERIAASIATAFPEAEFHTFLGRRAVAERMGIAERAHFILPERPSVLRAYKAIGPLYPLIARVRRLPAADLLISSSFAFAHHLRSRNRDARHLCYSYSPLRIAWSMTDDYGAHLGGARARAAAVAAGAFRSIDRRAARRVDRYVAESHFIADQLRAAYGVEPGVVHPPVDTDLFRPAQRAGHDGYFLFCGRLVEAYKRPSVAVDAFHGRNERLIVAGDGPALDDLRRRAGPNVEFTGQLRDDELIPLMQRCAAAVFPSRDDFGLIPVEVMACGRPVLAFAGGGALETVRAGETGEFFAEQTPAALAAALDAFDPDGYDSDSIRRHALGWGEQRFVAELRAEAARLVTAPG